MHKYAVWFFSTMHWSKIPTAESDNGVYGNGRILEKNPSKMKKQQQQPQNKQTVVAVDTFLSFPSALCKL